METRSFLELVESRLGSLLVVAVNVAATKILGSCKGNKMVYKVHEHEHAWSA